MIYKTRTKHASNSVDANIVIKRFKGRSVFVRSFDRESRLELLDFLESEGFTYLVDNVQNRDDIRSSGLPLSINLAKKEISRMGNVTCAAAACSSKMVISEAEFYILYELFG